MSPKTKAPNQKIATGKLKVPNQAIATARRDYKRYQAYIKPCKNPDPILNKTKEGKEKGIELFQEMKRDCHIAFCLDRLTLSVTRNPFAVTPGGETPQDTEAAEFMHGQIKKRYYNLIAFILDAVPMGYSLSEFWCATGERTEIVALKKRRQDRFTFDENSLLQLRTESKQDGEPIPQEGFIVATYQEEDSNPWGNGVLSDCFWPWWFKKYGVQFWSNSLERFNQPIAVGTYPGGTDEDKQAEFLEALESIQNDFAMIIPDGWKAELVKGMESGAFASYENFVAYMDRAISRRILGSSLNEGEQKFGSKGANETIKIVGDERIEAVAEFAASVVNNQLIPRLCDWNFDLAAYPEFSILYANKKITKDEAETLDILGDRGLAIPAAEIYEAQGWKVPKPGDLVLYKGKLISYGDVAKENEKVAPASTPPANFTEILGKIEETAAPAAADNLVIEDDRFIDSVFAAGHQDLRAAYDEEQLLALVDKAGDYAAASKALSKHKPKGLEEAWRDVIELGRWLGEYSASRQVAGGQFVEAAALDPALQIEEAFDASFRKLKPKEAIAWLNAKVPVKKSVYDSLSLEAKNAAFYVSGLEDLELINAVRERMIRALEKGIPFEQFRRELKAASGADLFFGNMKTAYYTNIHQAMAAQDYQALERVKDLVPYWRFSAVIDNHTRPEHRKWHNFVAPATDPIWNYLYSLLMDFNCRCRIVAATEEDYKRLAPAARGTRAASQHEDLTVNPTLAANDKLKELLKVKKGYADYLDGKVGSWAKIVAKTRGK